MQNQLCEAGFYLYWHVAKKVFSLGIFISSLFSWHFMNGLSRVVHNSPASTVAICFYQMADFGVGLSSRILTTAPELFNEFLVVSFFVPAAHRNLLSTCAPFVVMAFSVPVACRYLFSTDGYSVQNFVHWTRLRILPCLPIWGPYFSMLLLCLFFSYVHTFISYSAI